MVQIHPPQPRFNKNTPCGCFLLNMCVVLDLNHRRKVVHHKREPDGSMAVNLSRLTSAVAARLLSAPNPSPATTNFLKIPRLRYFCLENSVPRHSPKDEGGLCQKLAHRGKFLLDFQYLQKVRKLSF